MVLLSVGLYRNFFRAGNRTALDKVHFRIKKISGSYLLPTRNTDCRYGFEILFLSLILSNDTIVKPPYTINPTILNLIASISEKLGEVKAAYLHKAPTELRKRNRIRTIHSSLAVEGNTLTIDQVTAILDHKRVVAPRRDILEVQNAITTYDRLAEFKPYSIESICKAHRLLMNGLIDHPGELRRSSVGIVKGEQLTHLAPPAERVRTQLNDLLHYLKTDPDLMLVKSCVFHYEFEYIHPFLDGNGRMGRLWHTVLLSRHNPVFEYVPIETLIKSQQEEYYRVLELSDNAGHSTPFVEFMLGIIDHSLSAAERIDLFRMLAENDRFARADYLRYFKDISSATASRDLATAVETGVLERIGTGRTTQYRFIR